MPHSLFSTDTDLTAENPLCLFAEFGCPMWVYNTQITHRQIITLKQFDVVYLAQRACSDIRILRLMREQNVKVDSVSLGKIEHALAADYNPQTHPDDIVLMVDVIDQTTLERISELQVPVNAGSVDILDQLDQVSPEHRVWLRVNPGFGYGHSQKTNTSGENGKHGTWHTDLPAVLGVTQCHHLQLVGIHMYTSSGVDYAHLEQVCDVMVRQVLEFGQDLQAISAGGGLSIPYQQGEEAIDTEHYYSLWNATREQITHHLGHPVKLEIEPGRFPIAQADVLITQVWSVKQMGSYHSAPADAGLNGLMRPVMYGGCHHISTLVTDGRSLEHAPAVETIVVGPLCKSGDVFTQREGGDIGIRALPEVKADDYLALHNTGAYGISMPPNCNSRPLLPEVLFGNGQAWLIRRRQAIEELLTLELL